MTKNISFQGFHGAYSDLSCRTVFPDYKTLPCTSFDDAFSAVQTGKASLAMIPVDNSLAGRVADVHHLIPESNLHIIGEHFQPVRHALLGIKGADINNIKHVHSHIHAIPQCRKIIAELGLTTHVHVDTAGAAKDISVMNDPEHAAISSTLAAEIYNLDIVREDVQDADHNTTRFLILSPEKQTPAQTDGVMTSILFTVRNIPAALYKSLGGFASNGLSMSKLESYVSPTFEAAQFYVDVEGHVDTPAFQNALEELNFYAKDVKILGCYPAHSFRQKS